MIQKNKVYKSEEIYPENDVVKSEINYLSRGCMQHYSEQPQTLVLQGGNT